MILPCAKCKGLCCVNPVFQPDEKLRVDLAFGPPKHGRYISIEHVVSYNGATGGAFMLINEIGDKCPFLSPAGCSIGSLRPKVCRDYGEVAGLPCEFLYPEKSKAAHDARVGRIMPSVVAR